MIIPDITKPESNNCFITHCFEENNDKRQCFPASHKVKQSTIFFALPHKNISTLALILFVVWLLNVLLFKIFEEQFLRHFCRSFQYFPNIYLQVISQFLVGSMKLTVSLTLLLEIMHRAQPTDYYPIC